MTLALGLALLVAAAPKDLAVSGVVLGRTPERSTAILTSGGRTRVVAVGDSAFGGRVTGVDAEAVTLDFDGERVVLRLPTAARSLPPPGAAAGAAEKPLSVPGAPPEDPATPARSMERVELQRRLGDEIPRILAETTVAPVL
jgi:hypothetical protein